MIGVKALLSLVAMKQRKEQEAQTWVKQGFPPSPKAAKETKTVAATTRAESRATAAAAESDAQQTTRTAEAKS